MRFKGKRGECRICGKLKHLSQNGNCKECAANKINSAVFQIKAKEGNVYERWKQNLIKGLEKRK